MCENISYRQHHILQQSESALPILLLRDLGLYFPVTSMNVIGTKFTKLTELHTQKYVTNQV